MTTWKRISTTVGSCALSLVAGFFIAHYVYRLDNQQQDTSATGQHWYSDVTASDWMMLGLTLAITAATIGMWVITDRSLKETRRSVSAYLSSEKGRVLFRSWKVDKGALKVVLRFKNVGRSYANLYSVSLDIEKMSATRAAVVRPVGHKYADTQMWGFSATSGEDFAFDDYRQGFNIAASLIDPDGEIRDTVLHGKIIYETMGLFIEHRFMAVYMGTNAFRFPFHFKPGDREVTGQFGDAPSGLIAVHPEKQAE